MRLAYVDHLQGLTGDMLLGALIDAGARRDEIAASINRYTSLTITLSVRSSRRRGLTASRIKISTSDAVPPLSLADLLSLCDRHSAPQRVSTIWTRLFDAEAPARNVTPDRLTLTDVGGVQSLVEILGVCEALTQLRIDRIYSEPVPMNAGPDTPSPVTTALALDFPVRYTGQPMPVTPAGVALLTSLVDEFVPPPVFTLCNTGYGRQAVGRTADAGLIRVCLGKTDDETPGVHGDVIVVETNIDDMNPQYYGYVVDLLLERGALDAYLVPVIMKKGRPGVLLTALVERPRVDDITSTILRETTTIGVRMYPVERQTLSRRIISVETGFGPIRIKVVRHGSHVRYMPEYDDCLHAAHTRGIPLSDVYAAVRTAADRLDLDGVL